MTGWRESEGGRERGREGEKEAERGGREHAPKYAEGDRGTEGESWLANRQRAIAHPLYKRKSTSGRDIRDEGTRDEGTKEERRRRRVHICCQRRHKRTKIRAHTCMIYICVQYTRVHALVKKKRGGGKNALSLIIKGDTSDAKLFILF